MKASIGTMEEEYRIVNGLKLPPKRHIVVKRKISPSSSVTGTPPPTTSNQRPTSSEAHSDQKNEQNSSLPFGAIRTVFFELKKKSKCKDIVLPEQPEFQKKWAALAKGITEKIGKSPNRHDAIALIDCKILGGCEQGALIDKSGIYVVNQGQDLTGWLDWNSFVEKAEIARKSTSEISICSQPSIGLDISRCKLTIGQTHKLFANVLDKASGGKVKASQVRAISFREHLRDWAGHGIMYFLVGVPLATLAVWVVMNYAHVRNVEKAFAMYCQEHHVSGYRGIVSVDVQKWTPFSEKYACSAKVKVATNRQPEGIIDVTFMARRVSVAEVLWDTGVIQIDMDVRNELKKEGYSDDNWHDNWDFWGWIGDDYHIWDVKKK